MGSKTKIAYSVSVLVVVRFRSRVKGQGNIFGSYFFYLMLYFFPTSSVKRQLIKDLFNAIGGFHITSLKFKPQNY